MAYRNARLDQVVEDPPPVNLRAKSVLDSVENLLKSRTQEVQSDNTNPVDTDLLGDDSQRNVDELATWLSQNNRCSTAHNLDARTVQSFPKEVENSLRGTSGTFSSTGKPLPYHSSSR